MKKFIIFLLIPLITIGIEFTAPWTRQGQELPELSCSQLGVGGCIALFADKILEIFYRLSLFIGAIMLIWAGLLYITGAKEPKSVHKYLIWGFIGIALAVLAYSIVLGIENFILRLK